MAKIDWFHEARFGMFIHWGPYSVAGRGEWIYNRECIPAEEYVQKYVDPWKAEQYDPRAWARLAKEAGMRYMVLTARHHDGFCLWDTKTTDWRATARGPGRDLVGPYVEAARAEGLRVGLYYSGADWHHPDYPDGYARDWPTEWPDPAAHKRFVDYAKAQIEELLTRYGTIDILWYDGCAPGPFADDGFNEWVYSLAPEILLNDRMGSPCDYENCEQRIVAKEGPWEACMTLNDHWGYHAGDTNWKNEKNVLLMLMETAKGGGNLLLNVGPRPDGAIPEESVRILSSVGEWLGRNGEWLYGSTRSPFSWILAGKLTTKANTVYLHLPFGIAEGEICVAEIANKVLGAKWVDGGAPVPFEQKPDGRLMLRDIPFPLPDPLCATIAIEVEGTPQARREQSTFWIPG